MSVTNIEKYLQYLQCFAKEPINFQGETIGKQITETKLNKTLFYTDNCINCGGCCPAESNLYTQSEYVRLCEYADEDMEEYGLDPAYLHDLKTNLVKVEMEINGEVVEVYEFQKISNVMYLPTREKEVTRCSWCFKDDCNRYKCRIHPITSITCVMPHLRTYHMQKSQRSSIGIHQFGRNWALKCPVDLTPPETEEEFERNKGNVIAKLLRLHQSGLDLNIDTRIPELVDHIKEQKFSKFQGHIYRYEFARIDQKHLFELR